MDISLKLAIYIPTIISALILATFIFVSNRKNKVNLVFSLLIICVAWWLIFSAIGDTTTNNSIALFATRIGIIGPNFIASLFLYFALIFPRRKKFPIYVTYLIFLIPVILTLFSLTPLNITSVAIRDYGVEAVSGIIYPFFLIFFVIFSGIALFIFLRELFSNKLGGAEKLQIKYILLGFFLTALLALIPNVFLVIVGYSQYLIFSVPSILIFLFLTAYSIVKHRLMDIRMVVARSVAYIILIVILASLYAGAVIGLEYALFPGQIASFSIAQTALRTVLAVIMVFLFQPIRNWITKATDKVFFRGRYDADQLLSELSNTMSSTIVLIELLYRVSDLIQKNIKSARVLTALVKDETRMYNVQANGYKENPDIDPRDVYYMAKDGIIIKDDLEDGTRRKKILTQYNATMAVPLKTDSEVIGVILMGEKSSGEMYNQQDIKVMEIIGPELAVAVENAKSYEEISKFNVTLRQEVKRATYRLKQKNSELQELDKAKDEFISMASHQLRTPLTAIKGYLSMLLEGDAGDIKVSQYDFINEAYSGANRMVGLINDLLNVSRMETGRFFLEPKEVDIERIVNEEVKQLSQQARTKGLYLKVENKGKVPHIWADETKIRQVVMNFMDNALYYTITGGVTVTLRHDKTNLFYEVHDTGIGVPADQKRHLFEKFFRADNARTTRPDGTGLGIYLAKRVIEDHGGEIIFESEVGKGSMFGFKFPLKKKVGPKPISAPAPRTVHTAETMQAVQTEIVEKAAIK